MLTRNLPVVAEVVIKRLRYLSKFGLPNIVFSRLIEMLLKLLTWFILYNWVFWRQRADEMLGDPPTSAAVSL